MPKAQEFSVFVNKKYRKAGGFRHIVEIMQSGLGYEDRVRQMSIDYAISYRQAIRWAAKYKELEVNSEVS